MKALAKDVALIWTGAVFATTAYLTWGLMAAVVTVLVAGLVGAAVIYALDQWEARR